jgi:hypothetical protein
MPVLVSVLKRKYPLSHSSQYFPSKIEQSGIRNAILLGTDQTAHLIFAKYLGIPKQKYTPEIEHTIDYILE